MFYMSSLTALNKYFEQIKFERHLKHEKIYKQTQEKSNTILSNASDVDKANIYYYVVFLFS